VSPAQIRRKGGARRFGVVSARKGGFRENDIDHEEERGEREADRLLCPAHSLKPEKKGRGNSPGLSLVALRNSSRRKEGRKKGRRRGRGFCPGHFLDRTSSPRKRLTLRGHHSRGEGAILPAARLCVLPTMFAAHSLSLSPAIVEIMKRGRKRGKRNRAFGYFLRHRTVKAGKGGGEKEEGRRSGFHQREL